MKGDTKIELSFSCDQNWEEMAYSSAGRYCELCRNEVGNYTKYSDQELGKLLLGDVQCGRFKVEQVDHNLIKPIEFPYRVKVLGFFSTLFLGIISKESFGQTNENHQIEITQTNKRDSNSVIVDSCSSSATIQKPLRNNQEKVILKTKRRQYYWTRRFPFIKSVKRRYLMGKFRH